MCLCVVLKKQKIKYPAASALSSKMVTLNNVFIAI